METKISPVRPIIYRFYGTSDWALEPNTYVYYRVMMVDSLQQEYGNYMILFQGKNFTMVDDNNQPYLDFDFTDILSDYMYKSGLSLEPEYSAYQEGGFCDTEFKPHINQTEENIPTLFAKSSRYGITGAHQLVLFIYRNSDLSGMAKVVYPFWVTSSWNIKSGVLRNTDFTEFQNLLKLRTNFVSHYPKVVTDKYFVGYAVNISSTIVTSYRINGTTPCIYVSNAANFTPGYDESNPPRRVQSLDQYTGLRYYVRNGYGGFLPFNAPLDQVILSLDPDTYVPGHDMNTVDCETSTPFTADYVIDGETSINTAQTIFDAGNASTEYYYTQQYDARNSIYLWTESHYESAVPGPHGEKEPGDILIGVLDTCPAKYYATWMTTSGVPVSYGFYGNCKRLEDNESTSIISKYRQNIIKTCDNTPRWNIKSDWVNATTYDIFKDMFTSPYVILYDVERDEIHYVELETSDWEEKTVKELKRPLTFEFTCKETVINKIKY